jgi:hypothetical protein
MRHSVFLFCAAVLTLQLLSCKPQSDNSSSSDVAATSEEQELTCDFAVDGKSYAGRASTQNFPATKEFSVLCQGSGEEAKLIQFVFKDEASARSNEKFKIVSDNAMSAEGADEVSLTFDNVYSTRGSSGGTVMVTKGTVGNVVEFKDVTPEKMTGERATVSGKIQF